MKTAGGARFGGGRGGAGRRRVDGARFGGGRGGAGRRRLDGARGGADCSGAGRRRVDGARGGARGQATVETIALAPVVIAIGLAMFQLLAVGYASVLAGNAAEAGALALAAGTDARDGAERALPGWSRARAHVDVDGGRVKVHLRPPSPLEALADGLEVSASAAVEAP